MNTWIKTTIAASCLGACAVATAGGAQSGTITSLLVRADDGLVSFQLSGNASGKPGCAAYSYWIIKDETSVTGKQQLALLMLARAQNLSIAVSGQGTCTRWHDGEDVSVVQLTN